MINQYLSALIIVIAGGLVVWAFTCVSRHANRVHDELNILLSRAKDMGTESELRSLRKEIVDFYNTECYHRILGQHAREVIQYVDGKINGLIK